MTASAIADLQGTTYVSTDEIERFLAEYVTLALVARQAGRHSTFVQRELKMASVVPVMARRPSALGSIDAVM